MNGLSKTLELFALATESCGSMTVGPVDAAGAVGNTPRDCDGSESTEVFREKVSRLDER